MTSRRCLVSALTAALALARPAAAAQVTEDFTSSASTTDGATVGQCGQLTVALAAAGTITASGNGVAAISTPSAADAAILRSTAALPAGGYKITVEVKNVAYPKSTVENGVTLLAITNRIPTPGTEASWLSSRIVAVEIDSMPDFVNDSSLFVNYWDAGFTMYTWTGSAWGPGDDAWKPYFTSYSSYSVTVEKTASDYSISVLSGGTTITTATVPVSSVASASTEYLVLGDRITNFFSGSMDVDSVTMPADCSSQGDSGPAGDGGSIWPDYGSGWPDGFNLTGDVRPWNPRPSEPPACDCRVGIQPSAPGGLLLLALLLALVTCRRSSR